MVVALAAGATICNACFCITPDVRESYERARAVFVGEVLEIIPSPKAKNFNDVLMLPQTVRFRVDTFWKGPFWTEAKVLNPGYCFRVPMNKGEKYLVYADPVAEGSSDVIVSACSRTTSLSYPAGGVYEQLLPNQVSDEISILNTMNLLWKPRPKPTQLEWMIFTPREF
jgi:hypothetical protein